MVTGIAVVVGFLVIFQSMYTAVLERTREIGILKSLGSSKLTIVSVVLRETAVMAVAGVLLGIAGTYLVQGLLLRVVSHAAFRNYSALVAAGRANRLFGCAGRGALSRMDGGAQRPDRRAGLRIDTFGPENLKPSLMPLAIKMQAARYTCCIPLQQID